MASADQIPSRNLGRRSSRRPLRKAQLTTQASRRAVKRPRPRGRGMGGNRRKDHPKRGTAAATAEAALSEAESAERAAGQIQVLPDTLRAQHGVLCSEVSAKPRPCSRRGCVDWAGQFRAASRCAAGRSAPVTAQRKAFFLLTAPPPFSFCRLQKENGGGKLPSFLGTHRSADWPTGSPGAAGDWTGRGKDGIIPSVDKGKHGFSGLKQQPASFSSLSGVSPTASSASLAAVSAPEKLRRTFRRAMMGAGKEEDDGGLAPT